MKCQINAGKLFNPCHSPHGECGLKFAANGFVAAWQESLPTRGVWIEIAMLKEQYEDLTSLPTRGVWIEINGVVCTLRISMSLPTRGVWIEMHIRQPQQLSQLSLPTRGVWIEIIVMAWLATI